MSAARQTPRGQRHGQEGAAENALAAQQRALLTALFKRPGTACGWQAAALGDDNAFFSGSSGLQAYQSNAHALSERTLRATYPVIAQLVGDDCFKLLARDFWHNEPPARGDLSQWGGELATCLRANKQLAGEPYLGDVARLEWTLHLASGAADAEPDPASFALLSQRDPDLLTLVLSSGTAVSTSVYPVASIVTAHLNGSPTLEDVGRRLRAHSGECALVWRQAYRPQVALCSAGEAALVQALQSGASLLSALEHAGDLDFAQWLPAGVQSGLVLGARPLDNLLCSRSASL